MSQETSHQLRPPDGVPVLSRGRHRSPRRGACFMEMASYLAGERWSDHPACTHPLLAALARSTNDLTSDAGRPLLVGLVPSVIGLTGDDPLLDVHLALLCAGTALPVAAAERQRVLAVGVLTSARIAGQLRGGPVPAVERAADAALARAPHAAQWARSFTAGLPVPVPTFGRRTAPRIVHHAAEGLARACVPDPDAELRALLAAAIDRFPTWVAHGAVHRAADGAREPATGRWDGWRERRQASPRTAALRRGGPS